MVRVEKSGDGREAKCFFFFLRIERRWCGDKKGKKQTKGVIAREMGEQYVTE